MKTTTAKTLKSVGRWLTISILLSFSFSTAANASCWSNKAICQAICGRDCCSNSLTTKQSRENARNAINKFSTAELKREASGLDKSSPLQSIIADEILLRQMKTKQKSNFKHPSD